MKTRMESQGTSARGMHQARHGPASEVRCGMVGKEYKMDRTSRILEARIMRRGTKPGERLGAP